MNKKQNETPPYNNIQTESNVGDPAGRITENISSQVLFPNGTTVLLNPCAPEKELPESSSSYNKLSIIIIIIIIKYNKLMQV